MEENKKKNNPKLSKPTGEVQVLAAWGLMKWGGDSNGEKFLKWGDNEWVPADQDLPEKKK